MTASTLISSTGRYFTGHQVFDEIVELRYGSSIMMTDETFSEARTLLKLLFEKQENESVHPIEVTSYSPRRDDHVLDIGNLSIVETSINLNSLRRKYPRRPFIHSSLPDIIIKNDPLKLLQTFENWQKNITESQTIEFYLLPRGTFEDVERKLLSIVDGAVQIEVMKVREKFQSTLRPVRCSKPEYHMKDFPYIIEANKFLIYWEGEFTDRITGVTREEVLKRIADYKSRFRSLKILPGPNVLKKSASVQDYWTYSQLKDKPLYSIRELFPESFDSLLEKIVRWEANGTLEVASIPKSQIPPHIFGKKEPKWMTRLALMLPMWLSYRLFRSKTGAVSKVPIDLYLTGRRAAFSLITILMQKAGIEATEGVMQSILEMERNYNDIETRGIAVEHIKRLGEAPTETEVDIALLPKILKLSLKTGYEVDIFVRYVTDDVYEFVVENCFFCKDVKAKTPICTAIEGGMEGLCSVLFKRKVEVQEISCRAVDTTECTYRLTLY